MNEALRRQKRPPLGERPAPLAEVSGPQGRAVTDGHSCSSWRTCPLPPGGRGKKGGTGGPDEAGSDSGLGLCSVAVPDAFMLFSSLSATYVAFMYAFSHFSLVMHPVLLTVLPWNPKAHRERTVLISWRSTAPACTWRHWLIVCVLRDTRVHRDGLPGLQHFSEEGHFVFRVGVHRSIPSCSRKLLGSQGLPRAYDAAYVRVQRARHAIGDLGCLSTFASRHTTGIVMDSVFVRSTCVPRSWCSMLLVYVCFETRRAS